MDSGGSALGSTPSGSHAMTSDTTRPPLSFVRPEARRAYQAEEGGISSGGVGVDRGVAPKDKKSLMLLQQAANYASLAIKQQQRPPQLRGSSIVDAGTNPTATSHPDAIEGGLRRRLSKGPFRNLTTRKKEASLLPSLYTPQGQEQGVNRHDVGGAAGGEERGAAAATAYEDAPRLSISSAESSEAKTPESPHGPGSYYYLDLQAGNREGGKTSSRIVDEQGDEERRFPSSVGNLFNHHQHQYEQPAVTSISYPLEHTSHLNESSSTPSASERLRSQWLMEVSQQDSRTDDVGKAQDETTNHINGHHHLTTTSETSTQSRASTIRAKRPDRLMRLSSTRTDDTARPSPPFTSPVLSTAAHTPAATADNAFGKARNPMDHAVVTQTGHGQLASTSQVLSDGDDLAQQIREALIVGMPTSSSSENGYDQEGPPELSTKRTNFASPDSWRSLLPDNDPCYISSEALSSAASSRAASFVGPISNQDRSSEQGFSSSDGLVGGQGDGMNMAASLSDKDGRRLSTDSLQSSFSLAGPTAASLYASSNASGSLYEMDGTFSSGGSRAAFAPLQNQYNQSSKSLASPLLQHTKDRDYLRSNSIDETKQEERRMGKGYDDVEAQQAAYRRHASFSTFDNLSTSHGNVLHPLSPTAYSPLIHPDHHDRSRVYGTHSGLAAKASSPERQGTTSGPLKHSSLSSVMSPSSPASSSAMGNEGDRESWPSSRTSLQGWQSEMADTTGPRDIVQVFDPCSVDTELGDGLQQSTGSVESAPSILAMSTSTIESDAPGLPADHKLLTTTTLTTLASTTTTLIASPKTQIVDSRQVKPSQEHDTQQKPAYDVGPLSPATLPFLESRLAPASTELKVETHPTHYTLKTQLPGFDLNGITLATKHHRQLVIVADSWDERNGGHFERRVTFGTDADLRATKAHFDGNLLKITVPRVI